MENEEFTANPQQLLTEAVQEPRRRGLADYHEAIRVLKEEKEFSFRDIAVWLQQPIQRRRRRGLAAEQINGENNWGGKRPTRKPCPGWKEFDSQS
jgi:hypothetical protein